MGEIYSRPHETQEALIDSLKEHHLKSERIEQAFRMVDRANFMPLSERVNAYYDTAWRVDDLHMSAPSIYATVLTHLDPQSGQSFLNLGSGTGYLSCIVGLLIGPNGTNHGVEVKTHVLNHARKMVEEFRKSSPEAYYSSFSVPEFYDGNFFTICPSSRQYDLIYCGAGITDTEEYKSLCKLLKVNGRFIVPYLDTLLLVTMEAEGVVKTEVLMSVAFSRAIRLPDGNSLPYVVLPYPTPPTLFRSCIKTVQHCLTSCMLAERGWPGNRIVRYRRRQNRNNGDSSSDDHDGDDGDDHGGGDGRARRADRDSDDDEERDGAARTRGSEEGDGNPSGRRQAGDMRRLYLFLRGLHAQNVATSLSRARNNLINLSMPAEDDGHQGMAYRPDLFHEFFGVSSSSSSSSSIGHSGRRGRRSRPGSGQESSEREGASTNKKIRTADQTKESEEEADQIDEMMRVNVGVDISSGRISVTPAEENHRSSSSSSPSSPSPPLSTTDKEINQGNGEKAKEEETDTQDSSKTAADDEDMVKMEVDEDDAKKNSSEDEVKVLSETETDSIYASSGSTEGPTEGDDSFDSYNQEVTEEVLVDRTYDSSQELQLRIDKLPLPVYLKNFLVNGPAV